MIRHLYIRLGGRKILIGLTAAAISLAAVACSTSNDGEKPAGTAPSGTKPSQENTKNQQSDAIEQLQLSSSSLVMAPGAKQQLQLNGILKGSGKARLIDKGADFTSSNPALVQVDADGTIQVSQNAKTGEDAAITVKYQGLSQTCAIKVKASLQDTVTVDAKGIAVVTNSTEVDVVVNKQRSLPDGYAPKDLVEPNIPFSFKEKSEKKLMRAEAAKALEELFQKAKQDKIQLYGVSAYRSYATQKSLFNYYVKTQGEAEAKKYSAQPGQSEHQTGLSIDLSSPSVKFVLEEVFASSVEGKWLAAHAPEFGFIIRYPKGKESITDYAYEPWHIRYVGKAVSKEIGEKGITLEEYFEDAVSVSKGTSAK